MAFSIRNSRLVSVGLASVIAAGVIGFGSVALAQDSGDEPRAPQGERKPHHPVKAGFKHLLEDSGVTPEELREGATAGLTLGQIIDQYGDISADEAKADALADLSGRLDEAVANGAITQEQADAIESRAPGMLDKLLGAVPGEHRGEKPRPGAAIVKHSLETVAEVLGIDVATLRGQLAGGQTIAEIAGDQARAVIDALVADANAAIDQAVADGRIPEDRAGAIKEKAAAAIERFVNEGGPKHHGERPFKRPDMQ